MHLNNIRTSDPNENLIVNPKNGNKWQYGTGIVRKSGNAVDQGQYSIFAAMKHEQSVLWTNIGKVGTKQEQYVDVTRLLNYDGSFTTEVWNETSRIKVST